MSFSSVILKSKLGIECNVTRLVVNSCIMIGWTGSLRANKNDTFAMVLISCPNTDTKKSQIKIRIQLSGDKRPDLKIRNRAEKSIVNISHEMKGTAMPL